MIFACWSDLHHFPLREEIGGGRMSILASDHRFRASMTDRWPSVRSWKLPAKRWNSRSQQSLRQGYSHHEYYSRKDENRCSGSLFNQTGYGSTIQAIISRSIQKGSFEHFSIEQSTIQYYLSTFGRSAVNHQDLYFSIAETRKTGYLPCVSQQWNIPFLVLLVSTWLWTELVRGKQPSALSQLQTESRFQWENIVIKSSSWNNQQYYNPRHGVQLMREKRKIRSFVCNEWERRCWFRYIM